MRRYLNLREILGSRIKGYILPTPFTAEIKWMSPHLQAKRRGLGFLYEKSF
jgi:hypothetical protein